jgi:vancomycin resistance protein VanJ
MRRDWAVWLAAPALLLAAVPWLILPGIGMLVADRAAALVPLAPFLALMSLVAAGLRIWAALPALVALLLAATTLVEERPLPFRSRGQPRLVVVSHNVWRENVDPAGTIDQLVTSGADVLLLQEVDGSVAPYLERLHAHYPFGSKCRPRCSNAIFSRWPTERVRYRFRDAHGHAFGPSLVQARVEVPGVPASVMVVSLHLSRRANAEQLARDTNSLDYAITQQPLQSTIVAGDFNLPGWAPSMAHLEAGLFPSTRVTRGLLTYPARLAGFAWSVPLVAIDHVFAGSNWTVAGTRVLPAAGSDHHPVRVELVWHQ